MPSQEGAEWAQGRAMVVALGGLGVALGVSGRWHQRCSTLFCFSRSGLLAMGNLIKVLGKDLENCPHFFLDFESKSHQQGGHGEGTRGWGQAVSPSSPVSPGALRP